MKLREHRGGLAESMATTREIDGTKQALLAAVRSELAPFGFDVNQEALRVQPYSFDERNCWDTHIVTVGGYGVFGFTDGPLRETPNVEAKAPLTEQRSI